MNVAQSKTINDPITKTRTYQIGVTSWPSYVSIVTQRAPAKNQITAMS
jgi:hypothetical protein